MSKHCTKCGSPLTEVPCIKHDSNNHICFDTNTGRPILQSVCSKHECHTLGHTWKVFYTSFFGKISLRCERCGKEKMVWEKSFEIL